MSSDGTGPAATVFRIGANLYVGGPPAEQGAAKAYHANSILYHLADDSFTIGDRYPNLYVKTSHTGAVQWQLGGSCSDAPAGTSHCVSESWQVNHGHHLLDARPCTVRHRGEARGQAVRSLSPERPSAPGSDLGVPGGADTTLGAVVF